ncbi:LppX_LprAFG lipoprotein [Kineococcus sp. TBRC 1896]|uniref:LppX_LprAFG lipoprotein n=1 Tax=Kineococcus mangrovi TaxID=1660183 RepID=A0ABV4I3S1_9ACTN
MTTHSTTRPTSRRRRRIGTLAAGGAVVLALGLGACGGGDDSASGTPSQGTAASSPATQLTAFEAVKASARNSEEAGSAKFALTMSGTGEAASVGDVSAEGSFDSAQGAVEMTMTLPAQAGGTELTMRLVDGTAYLSGAPLTAEGQWVQVPLDQMGAAGVDTAAMDPTQQLQQLQAVAEDVRELPAQDVRGVQAKGYSGTIDAAKAIEQLPAEQQTQEAKEAAAQVGSIPFTLYVDDQDRPVRMTEEVTVEGSTLNVQMDFFDWGSTVDVAAPDPATVTEMPGAGAMTGGTTGEAPAAA